MVHCVAGISRSATIVIGYLMKVNRYSVEKVISDLIKALLKVKKKRSIVNPNKGFMMELREFEKVVNKQEKLEFR